MGTQTTIYRNGNGAYHTERNSLLAASQIAELQQRLAVVQSENTELNRRLSLQNRPGKRLADCAETASIILSAHTAGHLTGRRAIQSAHPTIGQRRWEYGVALLKFAGIVTGSNEFGLTFNSGLTVQRAWTKLNEAVSNLESAKQLLPYLPHYRRNQ